MHFIDLINLVVEDFYTETRGRKVNSKDIKHIIRRLLKNELRLNASVNEYDSDATKAIFEYIIEHLETENAQNSSIKELKKNI